MEHLFIVILAGSTSMAAYVVGVKGLGLSGSGLRVALYNTLECLGAMLVFLLVNLLVGMIAILTGRGLTGGFVSLYLAADIMLVVLSFLQALIFQGWLGVSRQRARSGS
jgi:hypothetical protein